MKLSKASRLILSLLFLLIFIIALSGCGKSVNNNNDGSSTNTNTSTSTNNGNINNNATSSPKADTITTTSNSPRDLIIGKWSFTAEDGLIKYLEFTKKGSMIQTTPEVEGQLEEAYTLVDIKGSKDSIKLKSTVVEGGVITLIFTDKDHMHTKNQKFTRAK